MSSALPSFGDKSSKSATACDRCRQKKTKCDGSRPCKSCVHHRAECHYSRTSRKHRGPARNKSRHLQERLDHAERLLRAAGLHDEFVTRSLPTANHDHQNIDNTVHQTGLLGGPLILSSSYDVQKPRVTTTGSNPNTSDNSQQLMNDVVANRSPADRRVEECEIPQTYQSQGNHLQSSPTILEAVSASLGGNVVSLHSLGGTISQQAPVSSPNEPTCTNPASLSTPGPALQSVLIPSPPADSQDPVSRDELHGPNSYLSVCADPGTGWIKSRVGNSNFDACAAEMVSNISRKLKLHERLDIERFPEPLEQTARLFTRAYFEESFEATFQTIDQHRFEARLEERYNRAPQDDDPAWYALRNIVFASGCRIVSFRSHSWTEAQELSRGYFENALSVEADLLHGPSRMVAIQALLVMALFSEGTGCAKLEYMLVSCAARLAHSRGLHLRPTSSAISFEDSERQKWIFWMIYCLEKHLTLRAGRPSVLDDDDISCEKPSWSPNNNLVIIEYFGHMVQQASIASKIYKTLLTVKARQRCFAEKVKSIQALDKELRDWYKHLPQAFKLKCPVKIGAVPDGLRLEHIMYLHFSYHGSLAIIHSIFGYPWDVLSDGQRDCVEDQVASSNKALTDSSRQLLLVTRYIPVDAAAPIWLVFFFPLLGMINMFISILRSPLGDSALGDVALLEMAAGHFAYLDYTTEAVFSLSFIKNLSQWARQAIGKAAAGNGNQQEPLHATTRGELDRFTHDSDLTTAVNQGRIDLDGMNFGDWPVFLSLLHQYEPWP